MKRYDIRIDDHKQEAEYGFSAESTLKIVEQGLRDGAMRIFVVEHGRGLLTKKAGGM